MAFVEAIAEALQLDNLPERANFAELKRAFTPKAVRLIHAAIPRLWPGREDFEACLRREADTVSGLYCGSYEPQDVFRGLTRHAMYCDRIVLPDPFMYAKHMNPQYSPLVHPDQHRATTIRWSFLWVSLVPWIASNMVALIRRPGDFSAEEYHEILRIQREKFETQPKLQAALRTAAHEQAEEEWHSQDGVAEYMFLIQPDEALREKFQHFPDRGQWKDVDDFMRAVNQRRVAHPYYVDRLPGQTGELLVSSTGCSYEEAKRICALTGYHFVTDRPSKWFELETDHEHASEATQTWSPFAKALQSAEMHVLREIPIESLHRLREEKRLEDMRHFFDRVWRAARDPDVYSPKNAAHLAAELDEKIKEAGEEWQKIDKELLGWLKKTGAQSLVAVAASAFFPAAAPLSIVAALGAAAGGVGQLYGSHLQRQSFKRRFPAGFFLNLGQRS